MTLSDPHAVPTRSEAHRIAIAFTVALAFLMQGVDTTILTVAIPGIARDLGRSPLSLHLLVTAYLLGLAIFMPVAGWVSDKFGPRRVFCGAVLLFMGGSMLTAFMPDIGWMVPCRLLQGLGGALMTPVGRMIVLRAFGPGRSLDGMTWLTLPVLIGPLIGPVIGAAIIEHFDWRLLFFVNAPVCVLALVGMMRLVPKLPPIPAGRFDTKGFIIAGSALVIFQLGIEAMGMIGPAGLMLLPTAALMFLLYMTHARKLAAPALDLSLFSGESFRAGVIAGGIGRIGLNSLAFLLPLFLQLALGFRPVQAGLISALAALGSLVSKPILKRAVNRFGYRRTLLVITVAGSLTLALHATLSPGWPLGALIGLSLIAGAVRMLYFNTAQAMTFTDVEAGKLSRATSTAGVFQQLAMGLGISLSAALLTELQGAAPAVSLGDFHVAFLVMAVLPLLSLPVLLRRVPTTREIPEEQPSGTVVARPLRKTNPEAENKSIGVIGSSPESDRRAGEHAEEHVSDTAA